MFIDKDTVISHLLMTDTPLSEKIDLQHSAKDDGNIELEHRNITEDSEVVKVVADAIEHLDSVELIGEQWSNLPHSQIVPSEIVVAADSGLSTVYSLDVDYIVDYKLGKIRRIDGGAITTGQFVHAFYQRFEVLVKDTDYEIDYESGVVAQISPNQNLEFRKVYVDYELSVKSAVVGLVEKVITEAEDNIARRLKEEYAQDTNEQGIKTGITEYSLAMVCRALSGETLFRGGLGSEGRARGWRELSEMYEGSAIETLKPYLRQPITRSVSKQRNKSWEWS